MAVIKKLTGEELLELLKKKWLGDGDEDEENKGEEYDADEDYAEKMEAFAYSGGKYSPKVELDPEVGEFEEVAKYGGADKGSTWYSVKHFKDHDVYIRVDGYYTSYDGTTFESWEDCVSIVEPKEKTIIEYV